MATEKLATHFHGCQIATTNSVKQHKLKKVIAWLSSKEAPGMEFISLYLPRESSIDAIVAIIKEKLDSTENKTKSANRLQEALKNVIQHLRLFKEIPDNGIALFAGIFATNDSENIMSNVEEVVPPEPITQYRYEIDNHFLLEPLREMLRDPKVVGIVTLDSKEASFGFLNGERFEFIENITSGIHGKSGKGGSSQRRYERERDMELTRFFHRVAEHAAKAFLENHKVNVLLVGGPGKTKEDFLNSNILHYQLKNLFLGKLDTQSAGSEGVREVLDKSYESLKNMCLPEQKSVVQRLLSDIAKQDGLATYGLDSVLTALKNGEVEVAIVTDATDMVEIVAICKQCSQLKIKIVTKGLKFQTIRELLSIHCEKCGGVEYEIDEKDIIDVLEDVASQTNARVEVLSPESDEKAKVTALGGFAALLRFKNNG